MTDPIASSLVSPGEGLVKLALEYHKTVEGEYGCPGVTCPGVQRLVTLLEQATRSAAQSLQAATEREEAILGSAQSWARRAEEAEAKLQAADQLRVEALALVDD